VLFCVIISWDLVWLKTRLKKFRKSKFSLYPGSLDSPVCTGHCTVHCPVHRPRARKNSLSCALSGGSPDSYCALSGVHRTGTVDCLVRPYRVLKKASSPRPSQRLSSPSVLSALCSLAICSPPRAIAAPLRRSSGDLPRLSSSLLSGELLLFPLSSISSVTQ
jgi:hypothetical protein